METTCLTEEAKAERNSSMTGEAVSHLIHKGAAEPQRQADMRIKLSNVECEFQVSVVSGQRNVYVTATAASTSDMNNIAFRLCAMGYRLIHMTSQRTGYNETKAYSENLHLPAYCINWGLPKLERLKKLCEMPLSDKS